MTAPTENFAPVTMVEFRLEPGAWVRQDLPADYNAVVVVLEGAGALGAKGAPVAAGDVAWLTRGDSAAPSETAIQAGDKPLRALLYAGRPLREPVVARGPFVMNTEAEIDQAYADYRAGRFGPDLPARSRVGRVLRLPLPFIRLASWPAAVCARFCEVDLGPTRLGLDKFDSRAKRGNGRIGSGRLRRSFDVRVAPQANDDGNGRELLSKAAHWKTNRR